MSGKMRVVSYTDAGQMFIDLATGEVALPPDGDTAAAQSLLNKYGIYLDDYTDIKFVQDTETTKHFVVPARGVVTEALQEIQSKDEYHRMHPQQREMYIRRFDSAVREQDRPDSEAFFKFRIGDYSTSHCA